jgi:hypothetical protein
MKDFNYFFTNTCCCFHNEQLSVEAKLNNRQEERDGVEVMSLPHHLKIPSLIPPSGEE